MEQTLNPVVNQDKAAIFDWDFREPIMQSLRLYGRYEHPKDVLTTVFVDRRGQGNDELFTRLRPFKGRSEISMIGRCYFLFIPFHPLLVLVIQVIQDSFQFGSIAFAVE